MDSPEGIRVSCPYKTSGHERSGDERSGMLNVRQGKVRPQNIPQGYFGTKRLKYNQINILIFHGLAILKVHKNENFLASILKFVLFLC